MNLSEVSLNQSCYIKSLSGEEIIRRRMQDLGMVNGTEVKALFRAPLGEPTAYLVRGTVLAFRKKETELIEVEMVKENE